MRALLTRRQTETAIAAFVAVVIGIVGIAIRAGEGAGHKFLTLERVGRFDQPVYLAQPPGRDSDLYVVEKAGTIRRLADDRSEDPFLDLRAQVKDTGKGGEQGLLSAAFAPDYADSGLFYVAYTDNRDALRVAEYSRDPDDPHGADPDSGRLVLRIPQPTPKHHGGLLLFGPDGHLYIGSGDGGPSGDPNNVSQNKELLLGKILRINPRPDPSPPPPRATGKKQKKGKGKKGKRGKRKRRGPPKPTAYTIPADNPFVGKRGRDEIFAYGLRNPWRFSFDEATGTIAIGDVGDETYEEVDYLPAAKASGANFGWNAYEGYVPRTGSVPVGRTVTPVLAYAHGRRNCAITGGYVVRDPRLSRIRGREIIGRYIYGDYCSGRVFAFRPRIGQRAGQRRSFRFRVPSLSSFGEDHSGRIYLLQQFGQARNGKPTLGSVYRLDTSRK
jgi:glucose/arabinose dehydrogenase